MSVQSVVINSPNDYKKFLSSQWQKHLQKREDNALKVISLFAGCGGSSLGYSIAGYRELLAVEWNPKAIEVFKRNFPEVETYCGDIGKLSVEEIKGKTGIKVEELDVLDGSPPCQGFSSAGKRELSDDRNQLFREYIRILRGLKPKCFIMENVSGMVKGKMKLIFAECIRELKGVGYQVSARLLNAMYFHVPQDRNRMIFIGIRNDLGILPSHPKAESRPIGVNKVLELGSQNILLGGKYRDCPRELNRPSFTLIKSKPLKLGLRQEWGPRLGIKNKQFKNKYRSLDKPSCTITKSRPPILLENSQERELTVSECAILASFPTEFSFHEKDYPFIGNCVPPLFMEAIARHIRENIIS